MTFAVLVDEVRALPAEEQVELRHVIDRELIEDFENETLEAYAQAKLDLAAGKLTFTSDVDELMRSLKSK